MDQGDITANQREVPALVLTKYLEPLYKFRNAKTVESLYRKKHLSAREIAVTLGCGHSSINRVLQNLGIEKPDRIRRPKYARPSPSKSERQLRAELKVQSFAKKLVDKGVSFRKIAALFNTREYRTPSGRGIWHPRAIKELVSDTTAIE